MAVAALGFFVLAASVCGADDGSGPQGKSCAADDQTCGAASVDNGMGGAAAGQEQKQENDLLLPKELSSRLAAIGLPVEAGSRHVDILDGLLRKAIMQKATTQAILAASLVNVGTVLSVSAVAMGATLRSVALYRRKYPQPQ